MVKSAKLTDRGEINAAFLALYVRGMKPWKNYHAANEKTREVEVDSIMYVSRWDGRIGFIGGTMDEGDTPVEAVLREVKEEMGLTVSEDEITHVCSHAAESSNGKSIVTHLFAKEITEEELKGVMCGFADARDAFSEITGTLCFYTFVGRNGKGLQSYLNTVKHGSAVTVYEETIELLEYLGNKDYKEFV
jgi:U8 snoRNA-decapping enzyme